MNLVNKLVLFLFLPSLSWGGEFNRFIVSSNEGISMIEFNGQKSQRTEISSQKFDHVSSSLSGRCILAFTGKRTDEASGGAQWSLFQYHNQTKTWLSGDLSLKIGKMIGPNIGSAEFYLWVSNDCQEIVSIVDRKKLIWWSVGDGEIISTYKSKIPIGGVNFLRNGQGVSFCELPSMRSEIRAEMTPCWIDRSGHVCKIGLKSFPSGRVTGWPSVNVSTSSGHFVYLDRYDERTSKSAKHLWEWSGCPSDLPRKLIEDECYQLTQLSGEDRFLLKTRGGLKIFNGKSGAKWTQEVIPISIVDKKWKGYSYRLSPSGKYLSFYNHKEKGPILKVGDVENNQILDLGVLNPKEKFVSWMEE